jgi:hypothetical protein
MNAYAMVVVVHAASSADEAHDIVSRSGGDEVAYVGEPATLPMSDEYSGLRPTYGMGIPEVSA